MIISHFHELMADKFCYMDVHSYKLILNEGILILDDILQYNDCMYGISISQLYYNSVRGMFT